MDISDFEGLFKYKLIPPTLYILSWTAMLLGPILFPETYIYYGFITGLYFLYKILLLWIGAVNLVVRSHGIIQKHRQNLIQPPQSSSEEVNYAFIIPTYKEDPEILIETIQLIASHRRASENYLVFLAMEAHQPGSAEKATQIVKRFKGQLRLIDFTVHSIREFQQKGKASNVSWCAEHMDATLRKHLIDPETVIVTVIDADSWVNSVYFDIMDQHLHNNWEERDKLIFQPPQIFTRNNLDVAMIVRTYDIMHSMTHSCNLYSTIGISFPLSNYSISLNLLKRIGFWDTCPEAIGEDYHTTEKAFWKTQGEIRTIQIMAPFNQLNISTGQGYCSDINARFWQAERHARGIDDFGYNISMFLKSPFRIRTTLMALQVIDNNLMAPIFPWPIFCSFYLKIRSFMGIQNLVSPINIQLTTILGYATGFFIVSTYIFYQIFKRRTNKEFFKRQNQSILRCLEYFIFGTLINWMSITLPACIIAAFGAVSGNKEYIVADKFIHKKEQGTL